jgi:hypothetical protein
MTDFYLVFKEFVFQCFLAGVGSSSIKALLVILKRKVSKINRLYVIQAHNTNNQCLNFSKMKLEICPETEFKFSFNLPLYKTYIGMNCFLKTYIKNTTFPVVSLNRYNANFMSIHISSLCQARSRAVI